MIPQKNLSRLAHRLSKKGGRLIPETVLAHDYCLAWFLCGLPQTPLGDLLVSKGGTALKRCYFGDYRFSEDLDFTLLAETPFETIRSELDPVFKKTYEDSGIRFTFDRKDRESHSNSHTFFLAYEGPLPGKGKNVKVDITIKETLVRPIQKRSVLRGYDEYEDLPEKREIQVYSLDEIAIEKATALGDPARNEPRDLYDLWFLCTNKQVVMESIIDGIQQKSEFRGKDFASLGIEFRKKEPRLKALWEKRLAGQMTQLPPFEAVYREVQRNFRQANLL